MGNFKSFVEQKISKRYISKKFRLFRGTQQEQEFDLETVRNVIVNKMAAGIAEKTGKPREEVEDNIRLREIEQTGISGNVFNFKYSLYNRPLIPWNVELSIKDLYDYKKPGFEVSKDKEDPEEEEETPEDNEEDIDTETDGEEDIDAEEDSDEEGVPSEDEEEDEEEDLDDNEYEDKYIDNYRNGTMESIVRKWKSHITEQTDDKMLKYMFYTFNSIKSATDDNQAHNVYAKFLRSNPFKQTPSDLAAEIQGVQNLSRKQMLDLLQQEFKKRNINMAQYANQNVKNNNPASMVGAQNRQEKGQLKQALTGIAKEMIPLSGLFMKGRRHTAPIRTNLRWM